MQSDVGMVASTQDIAVNSRKHFGTVGTVISAQGAHFMNKNPFPDAELVRRVTDARDLGLNVL